MARGRNPLRRAAFDDLGLRHALSDRLLPLLVAAMAFLAALALAGAAATASLARHWQEGAAAALTVQVPHPGAPAASGRGNRRDAVAAALSGTPGIASANALTEGELDDLLRPWLGDSANHLSLPLPAVIEVRLGPSPPDLDTVAKHLQTLAPGTLVESHGAWMQRLSRLARSLQACAGVAVLLVAMIAVAVVAVATRAGLATRRDAIVIVHGLGATDGYIAQRFAGRVTLLATLGGLAGALAALPVLLGLAALAAPFASWNTVDAGALATFPPIMWLGLPALPVVAAAIGWLTAQGTVRAWLLRLP